MVHYYCCGGTTSTVNPHAASCILNPRNLGPTMTELRDDTVVGRCTGFWESEKSGDYAPVLFSDLTPEIQALIRAGQEAKEMIEWAKVEGNDLVIGGFDWMALLESILGGDE